ncbi:2-phospho-L-lactate guanylyltransferase [Amycolatopsis sp. K13G38]|uniref:Phosphoenolpyruvate guanylyltransferase n=1 Tax=Amycolatopsis acididurans TaxID=2724524 RepID=A0ABX1JBN3_9PSEU|nr:2-phospho-L-lactate guanylyltransferase [Amycolatopsis acididurans]NKQ56304.1 2-phospho-L-lactate guanylyltransferase [Amycolatopsis acididurans]
MPPVDLIVPLKPPHTGKSRLRGAVADRVHPALVLALAADTLAAAVPVVRRVLVVASDPAAVAGLAGLGADVVGDDGAPDLNAALRHGERLLRAEDAGSVIGALQADLPALRTDEFAAALAEAGDDRAFASDWEGTGTTLLLSAPGGALDPRFGPRSADAHRDSGAAPLRLAAPTLRRDVDTPADLAHARRLGLGERTAALLFQGCVA